MKQQKLLKSSFTGVVISDKMAKSAVVQVERWKVHPTYKKRFKVHKKYHAVNALRAKVGDAVVIESTRPISKTTQWRIKEIIKNSRV